MFHNELTEQTHHCHQCSQNYHSKSGNF